MELYKETNDAHWMALAKKALEFCSKMQIIHTGDENLRGVILEKVLPPDGTDRSPYYIRDLGTIFYVIAVAKYMRMKLDPVFPPSKQHDILMAEV